MSAADPSVVPVRRTPTADPFWDGLERGELLIQRCLDCGSWVHYPRARCSTCLSAELRWTAVEPVGTVYTFTVTRRPTAPQFAADVPQVIAVVALTIGVHVTTTLVVDDPSTVTIGQAVRGVFDRTPAGDPLLRFAPQDG